MGGLVAGPMHGGRVARRVYHVTLKEAPVHGQLAVVNCGDDFQGGREARTWP